MHLRERRDEFIACIFPRHGFDGRASVNVRGSPDIAPQDVRVRAGEMQVHFDKFDKIQSQSAGYHNARNHELRWKI
jgi:hypothetical protein